MSSSNKTSLGLNQWDATDPIQRVDFNKDNEILNEVLGQKSDLGGANFTAPIKVAGETVWHNGNLPSELGVWTPTIYGGTTSGSPVYSSNGIYSRLGNFVYIRFSLELTDKGGMDGELRIGGLPLTRLQYGSALDYLGIGNCTMNPAFPTGRVLSGGGIANDYILLFYRENTGGGRLSALGIGNVFNIYQCSGWYLTNQPTTQNSILAEQPVQSIEDRVLGLEQTNQEMLQILRTLQK